MRFAFRTAATLACFVILAPSSRASAAVRTGELVTTAASAALASATISAGLRPQVLQLALRAHGRAVAEHRTTSPIITVIDYSMASRERRLWVLDLDRGEVLAHELVAHGKASGDDLAHAFSNASGSYQSSLGTFITGATYQGKHGLSLRLLGLDAALNSNAEGRAIVVHGAEYVNDAIVAQLGRLGRSEGCPALNPSVAPRIIRLIQGGTVVFSYYPTPELEQTLAS